MTIPTDLRTVKLSLLAIASANVVAADIKEKALLPKLGNPVSLKKLGVSITISCQMSTVIDWPVRFGKAVLPAATS